MENTHKGHRKRMREKYNRYGADAFETHQLLEMLLFHSIKQGDTNPAAHGLLHLVQDGSFAASSAEELYGVEGVGEVSANLLQISTDTSVRLLCDNLRSAPMDSAFSRQSFIWLWFRNKPEKTVGVLILDKKNRYVDCAVLAMGRLARPEDYSEALISLMEKEKGYKAILCHNHKNGTKTPSVEDVFLTGYLAEKLSAKGFFLDAHYIVAGNDCIECAMI